MALVVSSLLGAATSARAQPVEASDGEASLPGALPAESGHRATGGDVKPAAAPPLPQPAPSGGARAATDVPLPGAAPAESARPATDGALSGPASEGSPETDAPLSSPASAAGPATDAPGTAAGVASPPLTEGARETTPLSPAWLPLVLPCNLLVPGTGHLFRGETAAGRRMLVAAGGLLAGAFAGGLFLGSTGASDVAAAVGVPLLVVGLGGFFTLGAVDAIGTFTDSADAFPQGVQRDAWNARLRAGLLLQVAPAGNGTTDRPALGAFVRARWNRLSVAADGGTLPGLDEWWVNGGAGARLVKFGDLTDAAGLWLEASVRHDGVGHLGFDATRVRVTLQSTLPLGVFSARLGRVTSLLRLGLDPTWVRYRAAGATNFELPVSGGFEVRWALVDWLRLYFGYENARDGLVGGNYLGFLGVLFAGVELALPAQWVLDLRALAGTPAGFFATLEWRL